MAHEYSSLSKEELLKQKDICKGIGMPCPDIDAELKQREQEERRDERDSESLSISRKALRNSNWANIIAISAIIIAIIAMILPLVIKK